MLHEPNNFNSNPAVSREQVLKSAKKDAEIINAEFKGANGKDITPMDVLHADAEIEHELRGEIKKTEKSNQITGNDYHFREEDLEKHNSIFDVHIVKNSAMKNLGNEIKRDTAKIASDVLGTIFNSSEITNVFDELSRESSYPVAEITGKLNGQSIEISITVDDQNTYAKSLQNVKNSDSTPSEIFGNYKCHILQARIDGQDVSAKEASDLLSNYAAAIGNRYYKLEQMRKRNNK